MRASVLAATVAVVAMTFSSAQPVTAGGLIGLHKKKVVDGKTCLIKHWHNGQSGAWPSETKARQVAIRSWKGLVRLEYGSSWANFEASIHKEWTCRKASRGQTACKVRSRPCKY